MLDIYACVFPILNKITPDENIKIATPYGVGWANSGGESRATNINKTMAVDGIENVANVLEEIENGRLRDLDYLEGAACPGGVLADRLHTKINM